MEHETIKACLNLYAVLQNLEDLVAYDDEMKAYTAAWDISIQFSVMGGPQATIVFKDGSCTVVRGKIAQPVVKLFFVSAAHLNKMMDGKGNPIPLKGFTKLPFLAKDFAKLTDKLEYYLKPTDELLRDPSYLAMNTRLTLNTAAYAIREIGKMDRIGKHAASHIQNGAVLMKILPDGPSAHVRFADGEIGPGKGDVEKPMACMYMKDMQIANDFLNGKMDAFSAIAAGDVMIKGQTPMLDSLSLILDRVPCYLA